MSGHSKWATTKHRKAAQDAKRSALFSKLSRNITVAAKEGGDPNPENNASLAAAIEKAKGYSLPKDKIKTAIDKAFGSGKDAANYETVQYEGYGPAGVAIFCEALTDNRNRTAADVRSAFTHAGGSLGTSGSVSFQFERKGQIMVAKEIETGDKKNPVGPNGAAADEDEFMMAVAEAGGDDYEDADEEWIVYTSPSDLMAVKKAIEEQGVQVKGAELTMIPSTPTEVSVADAKKVMRLIDRLEELEDPPERLSHDGHHRRDCRGFGRRIVLWTILSPSRRPSGCALLARSIGQGEEAFRLWEMNCEAAPKGAAFCVSYEGKRERMFASQIGMIQYRTNVWECKGVQWQRASASYSGLTQAWRTRAGESCRSAAPISHASHTVAYRRPRRSSSPCVFARSTSRSAR